MFLPVLVLIYAGGVILACVLAGEVAGENSGRRTAWWRLASPLWPLTLVWVLVVALAWFVFLCVVLRRNLRAAREERRVQHASEERRIQRASEEAEAACRRVLVASSRKRAEFEESLVKYCEVRAAFVLCPGLLVPDTVLPAEGEAGILTYGRDSPVPIPDLRTDLRGIHATLSFSRSPCRTFVPWEAVVGMRGYGEVLPSRPRLELVP